MEAFQACGIHKSYGGVRALRGVDFAVRPGSVHALLGENGAGKSTLVKIMTGAGRPDAGTLTLDGRQVRFRSTADAARHGVAVVTQELSLFPHLSVLANLFPLREPRRGPFVDRRRMLTLAEPILDQLGLTAPAATAVRELPLDQRQLVEIAKALVTAPRVLLLDEPTSALEGGATERLLGIVRVLRRRQVAVVFVSHLLEEVMSVCDEVTVLRDGTVAVGQEPIAEHSVRTLVAAMIGDRRLPAEEAEGSVRDAADLLVGDATSALVVDGVTLPGRSAPVSLTARPGEVVGLAGLAGAGPTEVLRTIAGIHRPAAGRIVLPGGGPAPRGQRAAIAAGVAYVSGDRRGVGLMLDKPVWENLVQVRTMALGRDGLLLRRSALSARARDHLRRLQIKAPSVDVLAGALSGGNQQKVVLAKWLDSEPNTLLLDDPTRGVDVGARAEIHALLRASARAGAVVLLHSSDLEELVIACDRVLVFHRGAVCAELSGSALTSSALLRLMNTGSADDVGPAPDAR